MLEMESDTKKKKKNNNITFYSRGYCQVFVMLRSTPKTKNWSILMEQVIPNTLRNTEMEESKQKQTIFAFQGSTWLHH